MAKEKKTKAELAGLIAVKIGVGPTFVKVIADPALGGIRSSSLRQRGPPTCRIALNWRLPNCARCTT
jgi:hypothetical protein